MKIYRIEHVKKKIGFVHTTPVDFYLNKILPIMQGLNAPMIDFSSEKVCWFTKKGWKQFGKKINKVLKNSSQKTDFIIKKAILIKKPFYQDDFQVLLNGDF